MDWYSLAGIFVHEPEVSQPTVMSFSQLALAPLNLPKGHTFTELYDTTTESVTWNTGTIPFVDHVVDSFFHGHSGIIDDIWVLYASPQQLGLLTPPWIGSFNMAQSGAGLILQWKAHLHEAISAASPPLQLICSYRGAGGLQAEAVPG
eukprot:7378773-Prymnesium_polylepis.2